MVKQKRANEIKTRGNHKEAQEETHARVDSKRQKERENEINKVKTEREK